MSIGQICISNLPGQDLRSKKADIRAWLH